MANEEQLKILNQGVDAWNKWREEHPDMIADLSGADLPGVNLSGANLSKADLSWADLSGADLSGVNLAGGSLSEANLVATNLTGADLAGVDFNNTRLSFATFANTNLTNAKYLLSCIVDGPVIIDFQTLQRSGMLPKKFLQVCGLPDELIDSYRELLKKQYHSCFISYASKDQRFVKQLHADLEGKGIRCWEYTENMKIGDKIRTSIQKGIRDQNKLLLVLSESSINSEWIEDEVGMVFAEERRLEQETGQAQLIIYPIRLDNMARESDQMWLEGIRNTREIGDFSKWEDHSEYKRSLERLLIDLKAKENQEKPEKD